MISAWVSVWDQALQPRSDGDSQSKATEKLFEVDTVSMWRTKYDSSDVFPDKVLAVLEDQAARGQVIKMTEHEARRRYPDLVVASLGAQRKDKHGRAVSARVLFDGTHGITVNTRTRTRDQEKGSIAADLKRVMREKSRVGVPTFTLTADVSEAHRQISQSQNGTGISSFDVASASYYWSLVASAISRLAQYLAGSSAGTWHKLVADDYHLDAGVANYRTVLFHFFTLCATANYLCHGARLQGVMWFRGWGLNSFTELECSESRKEGPTG